MLRGVCGGKAMEMILSLEGFPLEILGTLGAAVLAAAAAAAVAAAVLPVAALNVAAV
jgi:hypothetical protein